MYAYTSKLMYEKSTIFSFEHLYYDWKVVSPVGIKPDVSCILGECPNC